MAAFRVTVNVQRSGYQTGHRLAIPAGPGGSRTFEWLAEEATNRCKRAFGEEGFLCEFTLDGASIDPSDSVCDLLNSSDMIDVTWRSASAGASNSSSHDFDWDSGTVDNPVDDDDSSDDSDQQTTKLDDCSELLSGDNKEESFSLSLVLLMPGSTRLQQAVVTFVDEGAPITELQSKACALAQGDHEACYWPHLFTQESVLDTTPTTSKLTLADWGLSDGSTIYVLFQSLSDYAQDSTSTVCKHYPSFFKSDKLWKAPVAQTDKGMSCFLSALYVLEKKHLQEDFGLVAEALLARLCFPPAIIALQCVAKRAPMSTSYKQALVQVLYGIFRELVPVADFAVNDQVFEHSLTCWTILLDKVDSLKRCCAESAAAANSTTDDEKAAVVSYVKEVDLCCPLTKKRLVDPCMLDVDGLRGRPVSRQAVIDCIAADEPLLGVSAESLSEDSIKPAEYHIALLLAHPVTGAQSTVLVYTGPCDIPASSEKDQTSAEQPVRTFSSYARSQRGHSSMSLVAPLALKRAPRPSITLAEDGNYAVYVDQAKDVNLARVLFDPLTGVEKKVDADGLARTLQSKGLLQFACGGSAALDNRDPKEIVMVLLDVSGSMNGDLSESNDMSRLEFAKRCFDAFANRSSAYDYPHQFGLILFDHCLNVPGSIGPEFELFKEQVGASKTDRGCTLLYDALEKADELVTDFIKQHPGCAPRILCLSDGADNTSNVAAYQVTQKLQAHCIRVDSVLIGPGSEILHGISIATGGLCFKPGTLDEAVRLFELETVLSLNEREARPPKGLVSSDQQLQQYHSATQYDLNPKRKLPADLQANTVTPQVALARAAKAAPTQQLLHEKASQVRSIKRILQELSRMTADPHPSFQVYPSEQDVSFWQIIMTGPQSTPYENGVFLLYVQFPKEYPLEAPVLRFQTPIYHCNISRDGKVCHSIFDRNWSPASPMQLVLSCVWGLLMHPEPDDPLDSAVAEEYFTDKDKYFQTARNCTITHASKSIADLTASISTCEDKQEPDELCCPLSLSLFEDPVLAGPSGQTYERSYILQHLQQSSTCPLTGIELQISDLHTNVAVRQHAEAWRENASASQHNDHAVQWWHD